MADLNTGTNNMISDAHREQQRKEDAMHAIPGAFPGDSDIPAPSSTLGKMPGGFPDQQTQPLAPVETKTTTTTSQVPVSSTNSTIQAPMTNAATSLGHGPTGNPIVAGVDDKELVRGSNEHHFAAAPMSLTDSAPLSSKTTHPTPPRQTEMGSKVVGYSTGLPPRIPRQADGNVAPGTQGVGDTSVPIERSPVAQDDNKANPGTVKAGELAQEVAEGAATTAVAGGIAAKDAAVWTKDRAVENYPAARDTVVENATWAKDQAVENYPAVRDQTIDAATTAGNAAYSGAATAASAISSAAQSAYNATAQAIPDSLNPYASDTKTPTAASGVPVTVKKSLAQSGQSPEAAANPAAVGDKRALESELLAIAGSDSTKDSSASKTSIAPNKGPDTLASRGPFAGGHMPNRTESTDFVKILGTETYNKPHSTEPSGLGVAAQEMSSAHGGGPAAPKSTGPVLAGTAAAGAPLSAILGQGSLQKTNPDTSYTYDQNELKDPRNDTRPTDTMGMAGQSTGIVGGMPRSMHGGLDDHVAPPTGTAAQAPGHGPSGNLPSYSQAQTQGQAPAKAMVGDNLVKEVDYNKLASGTQSGVASTHYESK